MINNHQEEITENKRVNFSFIEFEIIETVIIMGMVATPKPNINTAESIVLPELSDANNAEYTSPHGNKPFTMPPLIIDPILSEPRSWGILFKNLNENKFGIESFTDNLLSIHAIKNTKPINKLNCC